VQHFFAKAGKVSTYFVIPAGRGFSRLLSSRQGMAGSRWHGC